MPIPSSILTKAGRHEALLRSHCPTPPRQSPPRVGAEQAGGRRGGEAAGSGAGWGGEGTYLGITVVSSVVGWRMWQVVMVKVDGVWGRLLAERNTGGDRRQWVNGRGREKNRVGGM